VSKRHSSFYCVRFLFRASCSMMLKSNGHPWFIPMDFGFGCVNWPVHFIIVFSLMQASMIRLMRWWGMFLFVRISVNLVVSMLSNAFFRSMHPWMWCNVFFGISNFRLRFFLCDHHRICFSWIWFDIAY
jgi:hypothetical protein